MDPTEIARDITVAIIANPNYKPGGGEKEAEIFATTLKALVAAMREEVAAESIAGTTSEGIPSVRDMRVKHSPLKPPISAEEL